jgi:hypothetical protein
LWRETRGGGVRGVGPPPAVRVLADFLNDSKRSIIR